ncbi:MCE family protein [Jatrophihabitans sp.]|uniref:MCE family protein n=1 Tax=Jatrophihabitans sp. TaxID=1932789 RepID=UPI0030C6F5F3|nr:virulence factor Mce family protein [Jatrophihabitans sp.]
MKPMRERNQVAVAIVGTVLGVALVLLSLNLGRLPFVNPSHTYTAQFANADGLSSGDDVRVLGISVGSVKSVKVDGGHVDVRFTVKDGVKLGDQSHASIEVATVLGQLYLQVESAGSSHLASGATIPVARTTVPYTLVGALDAFGNFSGQTDLPKLRQSLQTLATTINGISPRDASDALTGLSKVAQTLAGKQDQVNEILTAANTITKTLNSNSSALVGLLTDGDDFLKLAEQRQAVIASLLKDTSALGAEIETLISKDGAQLTSLLSNLKAITGVLATDQAQLKQAVVNLGQFSINISNATGSGPWLDLLSPTVVVSDNEIVGCGADPKSTTGPC